MMATAGIGAMLAAMPALASALTAPAGAAVLVMPMPFPGAGLLAVAGLM